MANLSLRGVEKSFTNFKAVQDLNLDIQDGEFFALLGPSGCGKTTTMRMIAGLQLPSAGKIMINDRDVTDLEPARRNVAMVFQDYALYPHMTLTENVGYPLKVRGVGKVERDDRVRTIAKHLQLENLLDRRPGQLSGGQQQRAAVGRAVAYPADVFLFDEPLSNLDAQLRFEARAFLKRLQREIGMTIVYVTHDQVEAMAMADRMAVMNKGVAQQVGKPMDVYRQPANTFVARFIGSPPTNLLPATVTSLAGARALDLGGGQVLDVSGIVGSDHVQAGQKLLLGVRPEHMEICDSPVVGKGFSGKLRLVEVLGAETLVSIEIEGTLIIVRLNTDEPGHLSDMVHVRPKMDRCLLYGADGNVISGS